MNTLWLDVRHGLRMLAKNPGFTAIAVLTLALGIGANSAIFSVVHAVLLRPLPYPDPDQLYILRETTLQNDFSVSYPNFVDWREQSRTFSGMAATRPDSFNLTGAGEPERLPGRMVSAGWLEALGIQPAMGRPITPQEDKLGTNPVVMIGHSLWQRRLGSDPNIIGKSIVLNGVGHTVVAVLPGSFEHHSFSQVDVFVPIDTELENRVRDNHPGISVLARLRPGTSVAQARAEMAAISSALEKKYPDSNRGHGVRIIPLRQYVFGDVQPVLVVLLSAVGVVLLIACANVSNLLLARSTARQKEITIRRALGARRGRLVQQLLAESILLSLAGGALGLLVAYWGVDAVRAFQLQDVPRIGTVAVNGPVVGFTFFLSLLAGIVFGILPAFRASSGDLVAALKGGSLQSTPPRAHQRLRRGLVISEFALTLALVVCAALLLESFRHLSGFQPGFDPRGLLTQFVALPEAKYQGRRALEFHEELSRRLAALPQVESAAYTSDLPLSNWDDEESFYVEGQPKPKSGERPIALENIISPSYFATMRIRLLAGRPFTGQDSSPNTPLVIVDENLARKFFSSDAVGKYLRFDDEMPPFQIIGVVNHVSHFNVDGEEFTPYQFYLSYLQVPEKYIYRAGSMMSLVVRTSGDPRSLAGATRAQVLALDHDLPVFEVRGMEERLAESIAPDQFLSSLVGAFAGLALLLAAAGLYGVISYSVAQRTREIGIRVALGADRMGLLRMVIGEGAILASVGVALGLAGSLLATRLIASQLHGVRPTDPVTFAGVTLLLAAVALAACWIPARRAMRVDPLVALRYE
ncbi:MAG TPA: ABC transporter permease [Candidatus Acidoferrales bacterium]|nr:ABC transporter permease [Candidatus Acidoferrales bacterium]